MADNPIDIKKLFNFDDTTPLDQVIVKIQQLNTFYDALVASAQKGAASVTSSMQVMQKSVDALEQEMVQADATTKKGQETITNGAAVTSKAVAQSEEYKKSITELNATIKVLQDQIDKLSESNKKIPKDNELAAGSLADLKVKLKDATDAYIKMGDATDAAIKQRALKNITDLNTAVKNGQQIVNDAKKATDIAAGSYNDLALKVANATKQLKAMEGGVGSNSEQFKALQKTINDGNTKLKEFDAAIGNSQRNVGDYKNQIEQLIPAIGSISPQISVAYNSVQSFGSLLKTFAGSALASFGAALALAGFSITQYFKRTAEGEQQLMEATSAFGALWEQTLTGAAKIGKFFFEQTTKDLINTTTAFNGQAQRAAELEKQQYELNQKRIEGTKARSTLEMGANQLLLEARESLTKSEQQRYDAAVLGDKILRDLHDRQIKRAQQQADIDNAILINKKGGEQNLTQAEQKEVQDRLASIKQLEAEFFASAKRRTTFIQTLGTNIQKQRDEEVTRQIVDTEKLNSSLIQADKDKNDKILNNIYSTEEQRKQAIQKNYIDERQLAKNASDIALQDAIKQSQDRSRQKIGIGTFTDLSAQSKADLLAKDKSFQLEKQKIDQDFANQSVVLANNRDKTLLENSNKFTKQRIDNEALLLANTKDADTARLNGLIETNNHILADEDSTYADRASALKSNAAIQIAIAQNILDKETATATAAAQNKILADNLVAVHTKELAAQTDKLQDEYSNKVKKINQDLIVATRTNVFTTLARDLTTLNNKVKIATEEQLSNLDDQLKTGNVSIIKYHAQKAIILKNAYVKEAQNQINSLESQKEKVIAEGVDTQTKLTAIEAQQAALRQGISEHENAQYILRKEELYQKVKQLANASLDTLITVEDNETQAKLNALDAQLTSLQSHHDKDLQLAGNNATVKAQIEANFTKEQAKIQKEQSKLKHEQAIRDKQLAEAKIIMNTAIAISETIATGGYFAIPLSIIVGALGALELAKVASTPIPAYFKGTDYSKEGFAQVAEKGRELAIDRSGDIALYDKPQIAYLNEGTKILTNAQTEPIMEKMGTKHMDLVSHQLIDVGIRDLKAGQAINQEIIGRLDKINDTTKRNKPVQVNYAKVGAIVYEFKREEETYVKRIKALSMGAWMK